MRSQSLDRCGNKNEQHEKADAQFHKELEKNSNLTPLRLSKNEVNFFKRQLTV